MKSAPGRPEEAGFTLIELLLSVSVLGIISFALTEAIIVGLKFTDETSSRVSGSAASQTLGSYFSADAQSADTVSTTGTGCAAAEPGVFLDLRWTDGSQERSVAYAFSPPTGEERDLIRLSCTAGALDRRIVGHFRSDPAGPEPVIAGCANADPTDPAVTIAVSCVNSPGIVSLTIRPDPGSPPSELSIRRRSA